MIEHGKTGARNWYLCKGKKFFYAPDDERSRTQALLRARQRDKEKLIILG